jgi:hypothetical protein
MTTRHGGNCGTTPFYLMRGQRTPEYDQGDWVIVWYDDLYNLAADVSRLREALALREQERDDARYQMGWSKPNGCPEFPFFRNMRAEKAEAEVSRLQQEHARLQAENGLLKRSLGVLERTISEAEGR